MMMGGRFDLIGWALFAASGVVSSLLRCVTAIPCWWGSITWLAGVAALRTGYRRYSRRPTGSRLEGSAAYTYRTRVLWVHAQEIDDHDL